MFEQQGNSHDEYLVNKSTSNQGADVVIVHHSGAIKSRFGEALKKAKQQGANLHLDHLRHWTIKRRSSGMATQHNNRGTSLHSENVDIVEKILRKIKDPLG